MNLLSMYLLFSVITVTYFGFRRIIRSDAAEVETHLLTETAMSSFAFGCKSRNAFMLFAFIWPPVVWNSYIIMKKEKQNTK